MKLFFQYTFSLFRRWKMVYGLIAFALLVATLLSFAGINVVLPTWSWVVILVASLYLGAFSLHKETIARLPQVADLKIECKEVLFREGGWAGAMPISPCSIWVSLELRNRGGEKAKLNDLRVTMCDLGTELFQDRVDAVKYYRRITTPGKLREQIRLPYDVPGRDWASIDCEIPVELLKRTSTEFAELLKGLGSLDVELHYEYEDMDGRSHSGSVAASGSFESFRERTVKQWIDKGNHELVYIVKGIET